MKQLQVCIVALLLIFAAASVAAETKAYKVIVNPANPLSSMSREEVSNLFLKKTVKFPNGQHASPMDLPVSSTTRDSFSKGVLGKPASAVDAYWQQLIFSGRDVPPSQKNEGGMLDFVRSNENGIGYVSGTADTAGVKVISVTD